MLKFNDVVIHISKTNDINNEDKKEKQLNLYYQKKKDDCIV
jgi:hypothetical protein